MNLGHLDFDIVSNFELRISYFASLGIFTPVESPLQIAPFMQNKANFRKSQMNVNKVLTKDYEKRTLGERGKNKPNSKPIKANTKPIKANKMPKQTQNKPNTKPISKGALHYQPDAGILTPETLSGVAEQRLSASGQPVK